MCTWSVHLTVTVMWPENSLRRFRSLFKKGDDSSQPLIASLASEEKGMSDREGSSSNENLNMQQWSSLEYSVSGSRFSGEKSDETSSEQQRQEKLEAMDPHQ